MMTAAMNAGLLDDFMLVGGLVGKERERVC
jgi:hypothetical protein